MATDPSRQERTRALLTSLAAVFIAGMEWANSPAPGDFVEPDPVWYANFTIALHGLFLLFLLFNLARLNAMTADRPGLRLPILAAILVGVSAAAYVVGRDFGMI